MTKPLHLSLISLTLVACIENNENVYIEYQCDDYHNDITKNLENESDSNEKNDETGDQLWNGEQENEVTNEPAENDQGNGGCNLETIQESIETDDDVSQDPDTNLILDPEQTQELDGDQFTDEEQNLESDDTDFVEEEQNLESDDTDFVDEEQNLESDDTDFIDEEQNLESDDTDFVDEEQNPGSDDIDFLDEEPDQESDDIEVLDEEQPQEREDEVIEDDDDIEDTTEQSNEDQEQEPTPDPVEATSHNVSISIAGDDVWYGWLNAGYIGFGDKEARHMDFELPPGDHILSIRARDRWGVINGLVASVKIDGDIYSVTGDGKWLVASRHTENWVTLDFDDSSWSTGETCRDPSAWRGKPYELIAEGAKWIWSDSDCTTNLGTSFFRLKITIE